MAKEDDRRKNFWDEEEEESVGLRERRAGQTTAAPATNAASESEDIDRKIQDARVLMEQTHQLYQHYFHGIEKRIPIEKVKMLETKIQALQRTTASQTTSRFKMNQFLAQYTQMKELWERKLRDLERK